MYEKIIELISDNFKSKIALVLILIAIFTGEYRIFGFLFLYWAINDLIKQETYLLEPIQRDKNPLLYWIIVLMWLYFSYISFTSVYFYY
jgi:ABC-type multidrug transport system fused ATPase/permease subunit